MGVSVRDYSCRERPRAHTLPGDQMRGDVFNKVLEFFIKLIFFPAGSLRHWTDDWRSFVKSWDSLKLEAVCYANSAVAFQNVPVRIAPIAWLLVLLLAALLRTANPVHECTTASAREQAVPSMPLGCGKINGSPLSMHYTVYTSGSINIQLIIMSCRSQEILTLHFLGFSTRDQSSNKSTGLTVVEIIEAQTYTNRQRLLPF